MKLVSPYGSACSRVLFSRELTGSWAPHSSESILFRRERKRGGGLYVYPSDYVRRRSLDLLALQAWATLKRHLSPAGICQAVFAEGISRLLTDRTKTNRVWEALHFLVHVFCLSLSFFFFFSSLHVVNALGTSGSTRGAPSPCERSVSTRGCAANDSTMACDEPQLASFECSSCRRCLLVLVPG